MSRGLRRFFLSHEAVRDGAAVFSRDDAHHLRTVLRLRAGDRVLALTPDHTAHLVELTELGPAAARGRVLESSPAPAAPAGELHLLQGVCRPRTMEVIIQKAVELGVSSVMPVTCQRSQSAFSRDTARRQQRWQRIAAEAAKQCERGDVPAVDPPRPLGEVLRASSQRAAARLMLYERATAGLPDRAALAAAGLDLALPCLLLVGPEGGFTDDEVRQARQERFQPFSLGRLILRSETAVIAALSLVRFLRGELG